MGVYPEPALCADDVSRLVPVGSDDATATALQTSRTLAGDRRNFLNSGRPSALLGTLLVGLSLAAATPGLAASPFADAGATYALRSADAPAAWGGEHLLDNESATRTIVWNGPLASGESDSDDDDGDMLRFGDRRVPRDLVATIMRAAEATGVDPVYMMALADKESRFDTDAKNPASSALGLFQFVTGTWLEMIRDHGAKHGLVEEAAAIGRRASVADAGMRKRILALRNDPYIAGLMAGELIKRDRARIEDRIGRELKTTELYLAHFLGTASAGKFLALSAENPDKVASEAFRSAARANGSLFVAKDGGKRRALTVAELHERIDGMIDRRISQFEGIAERVEPQPDEAAPVLKADAPVLDARLAIEDAAIPRVQ